MADDEIARLRDERDGHIAVGQALVDRINELESEIAEMRRIIAATAMIRPVPLIVAQRGTSVCAACERVFTDDGTGWFTEASQHQPTCPIIRAGKYMDQHSAQVVNGGEDALH